MANDGSVAPKERVNIVYKTEVNGQEKEVELPLKILAMGDYTLKPDDTPLEKRETININKNNFDDVMKSMGIELDFSVKNKIDENNEELPVHLKFEKMKDFSPDSIAQQVPELKKLMELREALIALKGPLGNIPEFRKKLEKIIEDPELREKLMKELNIAPEDNNG